MTAKDYQDDCDDDNDGSDIGKKMAMTITMIMTIAILLTKMMVLSQILTFRIFSLQMATARITSRLSGRRISQMECRLFLVVLKCCLNTV